MKLSLPSNISKNILRIASCGLVLLGIYGICISRWGGASLRINTTEVEYDLSNMNAQYSRFTLVNPTATVVSIKVQPACGCVVVLDYPRKVFPLVPRSVLLEINPEALRGKPGYMQRVEFECSDSNRKWIESIEVIPRKQS